MTKLYILQEIQRTTQANGGRPLPKSEFESVTGITRHDWYGVYWARWSDALREASGAQHAVYTVVRRHDRPRTAPFQSHM